MMKRIYRFLLQIIDSIRIRMEYFQINFDETKVPKYILPDPLKMQNGIRISSPNEWWQSRRPEILHLFQEYVYGASPVANKNKQFYRLSSASNVISGMATRKEIDIFLTGQTERPYIHLLLYVPNNAVKPVPTFLGLNFFGNHTINADTTISIVPQWHQTKRNGPLVCIQPSKDTRGADADRWCVEKILQHGYALATAYYGELEPDYSERYRYGIRSIFLNQQKNEEFARSAEFKIFKEYTNDSQWDPVTNWGAIGAWAWGLSRIMDYLESDPDVRASQVVLFGHSRLGKAALWAGAQDDRFAVVISNNS